MLRLSLALVSDQSMLRMMAVFLLAQEALMWLKSQQMVMSQEPSCKVISKELLKTQKFGVLPFTQASKFLPLLVLIKPCASLSHPK